MDNLKVGDIFVLSRRPFSVLQILEIREKFCVLPVSSQQYGPTVWCSYNILISVLKGRKKGKKKDWYRAIRQYNECNY